jgi:hypothetical protein
VTTIQIHIMLVFPNACLKLYNVITDNGVTFVVDTYGIAAKSTPHLGDIKNTSPQGPSDVVYVVNTCPESYPVDIGVNLQSDFTPAPASPGHSLAFFSSNTFDPNSESLIDAWGNDEFGSPSSTAIGAASLCLVNKTVLANTTYLVTAGFDLLATITSVSQLPSYPGTLGTAFTGTFSSFTSGVFNANSSCGVGSSLAQPNSITLPLNFSVTY